MASMYIPVPQSLDNSRARRTTDPRGTRITVTNDGNRIGYTAKRVGSQRPKKDRNRKGRR
jgi:hypothetical protein